MTIWWALLTATGIALAVELHLLALDMQFDDDERGPEKPWWE